MDYLKVQTDFLEVIEPLNDEEKGRLFSAMLWYAKDGTETELKGNERFMWIVAKQNIDRARANSESMRRNGVKGGRPRTRPPKVKTVEQDFGDELIAIQREHDEIFDALENAGFDLNNKAMTKAVDLYTTYGKDAMLTAIDDCVDHGAKTIVYLRKVLEGGGGKKKTKDDYNFL